MRVDIADVGRLHAGPLSASFMQRGSAFAVRAGRGNVVCIRGVRPAGQHGVDFCAAREGVLLGLDQERAAAFTDNEAVAVEVERAARLLEGRRFGGKAPWPATEPDTTIGHRMLSPPTARTASASPARSSIAAVMIASPPAEQAVLSVMTRAVDAVRNRRSARQRCCRWSSAQSEGRRGWPASNAACVCATVVTPVHCRAHHDADTVGLGSRWESSLFSRCLLAPQQRQTA